MTSKIDPSHPTEGHASTQEVRDNFQAAWQEISDLQTAVASLQTQMTQLMGKQQAANSVTVASPPNTMSPEMVCAGVDMPFTPTNTRGIFMMEGSVSNNSGGKTTNVQMIYGTGTPPANGTLVKDVAGTLTGVLISYTSVLADDSSPFSATALVTSLAPGTDYWIDVAYSCDGGVAQLAEITVTAFELLDPLTP